MEWWQTRALWRSAQGPADEPQEPAPADDNRASVLARDRSNDVEGRVAGILDRHARKHVGVEVGVWWEGETWTFARGRLRADRPDPLRSDTIFEIGSITKVFTATVLADMVEEGLVALDDPVQRYLPEGVEMPVRRRPITLADLAAQTSGLPRLPKGLVGLSRGSGRIRTPTSRTRISSAQSSGQDSETTQARRSATRTSASACSATCSRCAKARATSR